MIFRTMVRIQPDLEEDDCAGPERAGPGRPGIRPGKTHIGGEQTDSQQSCLEGPQPKRVIETLEQDQRPTCSKRPAGEC